MRLGLTALLMLAGFHTPALGQIAETTVFPVDGLFCVDSVDDGLMQFQGCGGRTATTVSLAAFVDTRLDEVNSTDRFARSAIEFDLVDVAGPGKSAAGRTRSAMLTLQPLFGRDLTIPGFPPPELELWAYVGDGTVSQSDMYSGVLLARFTPEPNPGNGPGGADWNPVEIDVTGWVTEVLRQNLRIAGFRWNITNDLSGFRNLHADFFFGAPTSGVGGLNQGDLAWRPRLIIRQSGVASGSD